MTGKNQELSSTESGAGSGPRDTVNNIVVYLSALIAQLSVTKSGNIYLYYQC